MQTFVLEIHAGVGGLEANLWALDLYHMYVKYINRQGWLIDVLTENYGGSGIRDVSLLVKGKDLSRLEHEVGIHRVQRVSATEKRGRIHTSTARVAVLSEKQIEDLVIDPADIRVDTFRGSGAGGQHRNKTDSAVRITHIPTGTIVTCQDERSQTQNRERALLVLKTRIADRAERIATLRVELERKKQIGTAERTHKMRTYNMPENTVTEHRLDKKVKNAKDILNGRLELIY